MFLQDFRVLLGCSLGTVARDLRVPRSTIAKIETRRMPGVKLRARLLRYYAEAIAGLDADTLQRLLSEFALAASVAGLHDADCRPPQRPRGAPRGQRERRAMITLKMTVNLFTATATARERVG